MGETQNPHFYDFGIFGAVHEPQNQYYLSLETPGYLTKSKNIPSYLWKFDICEFCVFGKCVSRTSWCCWNLKFRKICTFGTFKLWNLANLKLWTIGTSNFESLKLRNRYFFVFFRCAHGAWLVCCNLSWHTCLLRWSALSCLGVSNYFDVK